MNHNNEHSINSRASLIELSLTDYEKAKIYRLLGASEKVIQQLSQFVIDEELHIIQVAQILEEERTAREEIGNDNEPNICLPLAPYSELTDEENRQDEWCFNQLLSHCRRVATAEQGVELGRDQLCAAIEQSIRMNRPKPTPREVIGRILDIPDDEAPSKPPTTRGR